MIKAMMSCPQTGKPVFTGVAVPDHNALGAELGRSNAVGCQHCGDLHAWGESDCWEEIEQ